MGRKKIFILLYSFFIIHHSFTPSVFAQKIDTSFMGDPQITPAGQEGSVLGIFDNLLRKKVPEEVKKYNKGNLPPIDLEDLVLPTGTATVAGMENFANVLGDNAEDDGAANAAFQYNTADCLNNPDDPDKCPTKKQSFFAMILSFFTNLFGGIIDRGNQKAENFASGHMPRDAAREALARGSLDKKLALSDSEYLKVLGTADSNAVLDDAMSQALDVARCGNLPPAACEGLLAQGEEPTPTPDGLATPTPDTNPPPASGECKEIIPVCSNGDCYTDSTIGSCPIPKVGYCSEGCLSKYWSSPTDLKKAAQICFKESGGDRKAQHRGCFLHTTQEYSVGLFQINLWFDDRCPGALKNLQTSPYSCEAGPNFDSCTAKFQDPYKNIEYAKYLYQRKVDLGWNPWGDWSAAAYCGIIN